MSDEELARLRLILRIADGLMKDIDQDVERSGMFSPPLSRRSRVKGEETVIDKIKRKRELRPTYCLDDVSDIIGLRFVTVLRQEIVTVVDNLFKMLDQASAVSPGCKFKTGDLDEFKNFVSVRSFCTDQDLAAGDALSEKLKGLERERFGAQQPLKFIEVERAQYSSVHIIVKFNTVVGGRNLIIPMEIQVRSIFEDAWGELDHRLFYEADREGELKGKRERRALGRKLAILKNMLDTAEEFAASIAEERGSPPPDKAPDVQSNLDDLEYARVVCDPLTAQKDLLNEFIGLTRDKNELDEQVESNAALPTAYVQLADQFYDLWKRLNDAKGIPQNEREGFNTVKYLASMEEALCRLLSGNLPQMQQAAAAYGTIRERYKSYPACWFRCAQTCAQLMEKSTEEFEREAYAGQAAANYLKAREMLSQAASNKPLVISPGQRAYLDANIERLHGFVLWRLSDKRRQYSGTTTQRDLDEVAKAFAIAEIGFERAKKGGPKPYLELLNSAAYFAIEMHVMAAQLEVERKDLPTTERLAEMVAQLEKECEAQDSQRVHPWHTLFKGYTALGRHDDALRAARRVAKIQALPRHGTLSDYDREVYDRAFTEVWPVLEKKLP